MVDGICRSLQQDRHSHKEHSASLNTCNDSKNPLAPLHITCNIHNLYFSTPRPPSPHPRMCKCIYSLHLLGRNHQLGANVLVEVLGADDLELHGGLLEREPVLVRVLGRLGRGVVADDGVEAGDQHEAVGTVSRDS